MDGQHLESYRYRLRSSGLTPTGPGEFVVQTFGVDKNKITLWPATHTLPGTEDFSGASITGEFISANFQRLPYLSSSNRQIFSGQVIHKSEFVDESDLPGGGNL